MCLLFFYFDPDARENEYRLILINNRDEFYNRPTMPASFWGLPGKSSIGGRDQSDGCTGGTWLAMNPQNGRLSCILNILQSNKVVDKSKTSRGFLTVNFVEGKQRPLEYLNDIKGSNYNGFLLVALDLKEPGGAFYTNMSKDPPTKIKSGINVFGNSPPIKLWPKAEGAQKIFEKIVRNKTETKYRNQLVTELLGLLKDRTYYPIDDQMKTQGDGLKIDFIEKLSSVFVEIKDFNYGTRSHSIILVDGAGNAEYIEHSMVEPIKIHDNPKWMTVIEKFKIQ